MGISTVYQFIYINLYTSVHLLIKPFLSHTYFWILSNRFYILFRIYTLNTLYINFYLIYTILYLHPDPQIILPQHSLPSLTPKRYSKDRPETDLYPNPQTPRKKFIKKKKKKKTKNINVNKVGKPWGLKTQTGANRSVMLQRGKTTSYLTPNNVIV